MHRRWMVVLPVGAFCGVLVGLAAWRPDVPIDSTLLVRGAYTLPGCIDGSSTCGDVGPYPLLQYLVALPFRLLGLSQSTAVHGLAVLSALAFAVMLVVAAHAARRAWAGAPFAIALVLLTGPLTWYARSTFGEMLAGMMLVVAVAAGLEGIRPRLLAAAVLFASLGKETAPPFVLFLVGAAVWIGSAPSDRRSRLLAVLAGTIGAIVAAGLFKVLRYGGPLNHYYLKPEFRVPGVVRNVDFASAMWLSPNAGVGFFWPLVFALLVTTVVLGLRSDRRSATLVLTVAAVLAGLTIGLSNFFAPFGWVAWGPRPLLPWILPALLVAIHANPGPLVAAGRWVCHTPIRAVGLAAVCLAQAAPTLGAIADRQAVLTLFQTTDAGCPRIPVFSKVPMSFYYDCVHHYAWAKWPGPLRSGLAGLDQPMAIVLLATLAAAVASLVVSMRSHGLAATASSRPS